MRFLMVGTGAVGGYFGGMMARGGLDVTFVSRGRTLDVLKASGLTLVLDDGTLNIPITVVERPRPREMFDVAFVAVKSHQTREVLHLLEGAVGRDGVVISLQNGISNEDMLAEGLPGRRIMGGVAYIAADMVEPGTVVQTRLAKMRFGELDGTVSPQAEGIADVLKGAGVDAKAVAGITDLKWSKWVWNCAFNPLTALTGLGTGEAAGDPDLSKVAADIMKEALLVAEAEGHPIDMDIEDSIRRTAGFAGVRTSMLQDVRKGRPIEADALNGEVVARARHHGIHVPVNETVLTLLKARERIRDPWKELSAATPKTYIPTTD